MPAFAYTALDATGKQVSGSLSVPTRAEVYRKLEAQRLVPIKVTDDEAATKAAAEEKAEETGPPPKLTRAQLILFTEELADLLDGGLQLEQALRVMHERQESPILRRVSGRIREQVREGAMFSKALQNASPSFDEMYLNLSAAGEVSGSLSSNLRRLCANITQIHELKSKVVGALVYPAFLFGAVIVLMLVFSLFLVPQFSEMLSKSRTGIPFMMKMLMNVNMFIGHWWWLGVAVGVAAFLMFRGYTRTDKGRLWWDRAKLGLPLVGDILAYRFYAQLAASLANLVNNGIPLLNAMRLTSKTTANIFLRKLLETATLYLGEGSALSGALRKAGSLPVLLVDMIAMGEQTGKLGKALDKIAIRYDKELDKKIKRMTAMITPIMLVFIFVVVGVVAFAIVTSIFGAMSGVRGRA